MYIAQADTAEEAIKSLREQSTHKLKKISMIRSDGPGLWAIFHEDGVSAVYLKNFFHGSIPYDDFEDMETGDDA